MIALLGPPLVGTILVTLGYLLLLVWTFCRRDPRDEHGPGLEGESGWRDLRLWVTGLVGTQIAIYWYFR